MNSNSKILMALGVVAAVGLAIWLGFAGGNVPPPGPAPSQPSMTKFEPVEADAPAHLTHPEPTTAHTTNVTVSAVPVASANLITNWEDHVDQILRDETPGEAKAREMLELLPRFPEAGQVETARHIANLLADEDYGPFGKYLTNPQTPEDVKEVVFADALNRPNAIKLPLLLETARNPDNAKAAEAREILELYLNGDYGNDWNKWQQEMGKWLKDNPD